MKIWTLFFARFFLAAVLLSAAGAAAQNAPAQNPAPNPAPQAQAAPPPPPPAAPQIDADAIARRVNESLGGDIDNSMKSWRQALDRVEEALRPQANPNYSELNALRDNLGEVRAKVEEFAGRLRPVLDAVKDEVGHLPPPPAAGAPAETGEAAVHRAELNHQLGLLTSAKNAADEAIFRTEHLTNAIQDRRRKNFTTNLFQPVPGAFLSDTWTKAPANALKALDGIGDLVSDWWNGVRDKDEVTRIAAEAVLLWLVLGFLAWRGIRRMHAWKQPGEPPFWRRASSAAGVILLRAAPPAASIIFFYHALTTSQPLPASVGWLLLGACRSLIIIFAVGALIRTVFAPKAPHWRLIPASNGAAARICALVLTLAILYGASAWLYLALRVVKAPFALTVVESLGASILIAGLVAAILSTPLKAGHTDDMPSLTWLRILRLPIWLIAFSILATAFAGYLALSRFIAQQLIVTGSILACVYLMLLWVDGIAQGIGDETSAHGYWLQNTAGLDRRRRAQMAVPASLLLKFGVLLLSVPLILLQWGYPWDDIIDLYRQLFIGFHIGGTQVSLGAIIASLIVFILGYLAAKLFQNWLDAQILEPAGLSGGLRDSIRTGVGYLGVFAAALVAASYAGFNLSSLAIVAGAFSVGLGFGLQSVVSNFVSGLILLAERPIKVGDLVVVGGEEGYVRKISVRSTEIETFDRAHVLIPNSYFITEKVKNWTLRNNTGRVTISVGVAHGSDPRRVRAILLRAAKEHPNVMMSPEPFVDFEAFGADALNFKLFAFIHDLNKSVATRTDLRIAILEAFADAGIVFPSQQTDVTLREMDWLREAVRQYMADASEARVSGGGNHVARLRE